jgi:hypothetical protein
MQKKPNQAEAVIPVETGYLMDSPPVRTSERRNGKKEA